jgi:hypothetical protein
LRVHGLECGVQSSGFRVQDSGFRVQGSGFRVRGSGLRFPGGLVEHRHLLLQGQFLDPGVRLRVWGIGVGVVGLGFRVLDIGVGVWGLGFRV